MGIVSWMSKSFKEKESGVPYALHSFAHVK